MASFPFTLRPSQTDILRYRGGKLGISAVPGSGKTFTLSALAAQIITSGALAVDQDVLIVTLVNSAVDNFSARIGKMIEARGLIPHLGYRVRTLHGLAHDIVREKPALAGLEERFQIVDEREAEFIRKEAANAWLASFPNNLDEYLNPELDESRRDWIRRQQLPDLAHNLSLAFIRSCKNLTTTPEDLRHKLNNAPAPLPLAEMGWWIYDKYQQALRYRGAVDFDDLIALAYKILQSDPEYLARLQYRFPFILEDEAQDSSEIQENILRLLSGSLRPERSDESTPRNVVEGALRLRTTSSAQRESGNWVRVGDPNQAIFETFTTANPKLLKNFISHEADYKNELPVSGRSQPRIIELANYLIDWTNASHPAQACRDALSIPHIQATSPEDPQPNPPADPEAIRLISRKFTPEEETEAIVNSIKKWLPDNQDSTVAVLVPRNTRGFEVIEALKRHKIEYVDVLASTNKTRVAAGAIANVIAYLSDPTSPAKLSRAYQVWRREIFGSDNRSTVGAGLAPTQDSAQGDRQGRPNIVKEDAITVATLLRKIGEAETFVAPNQDHDWLATLSESEADEVVQELSEFRVAVNRWLNAVTLPIDQLILTLAQELFTDAADLALAHKLALVLRRAAEDHADWRLPELTAELGVIARNERRFIGFSSDDSGFNPEAHKGKVVVTTMHKAKGLEWDRVYMLSVNNYDFPSLQPYDRYISEKWFVRNSLNLEAEALAQLKAALSTGEFDWYEEGTASLSAREDYSRERLRLLYVGITRAKKDLIVTWNSGRKGDATPCLALSALMG
ncbi:MAG: ATP-dependent helicase [Chloroflexi bacterium]|nr:ATP-dependent helicase [Chloroflexota bacterium]